MSLEKTLSEILSAKVARATCVFGGDMNETYRVEMADGVNVYFLKIQRGCAKNFYAAESLGLSLLSTVARTPTVVKEGWVKGDAYLLLTWIHSPKREMRGGVQRNSAELGRMVAAVHQQTSPNGKFGSSVPLSIAGCETAAGWVEDWATYYIDMRLTPQVALARQKGLWNDRWDVMFAAFSERFRVFYDTNQTVRPSLLHGDLWSGNVMYGEAGEPYLIDPFSYYGHREVDIAMTLLFGGFDAEFYAAYEEMMPLEEGFELRVPWYKLLPLLCHLNLFGETYGRFVEEALKSIS